MMWKSRCAKGIRENPDKMETRVTKETLELRVKPVQRVVRVVREMAVTLVIRAKKESRVSLVIRVTLATRGM
jgi:hypothetical protein